MEISTAVGRILQLQRHLIPQQVEDKGVTLNLLSASESKTKSWLRNRGGQPVIIGGMVMDVQGMTGKEHTLHRGTTTPGKVFFTHGGVARNVAECLACLGAVPFLISVLGRDPPGEAMISHWQELGLPTEGILRKKGIATPIVSAILDPGGEIAASIDDITAIEEHVTPAWIQRFESVIAAAPIVVLDANLLPEAIQTACQIAAKHGVPTWFEPVSISKSTRASRALSLLTFVSPSKEELASVASSAFEASQNNVSRETSLAGQDEPASRLEDSVAIKREGSECGGGQTSRSFTDEFTRRQAGKGSSSGATLNSWPEDSNMRSEVDIRSVTKLLRKHELDVRKILEAGVRYVVLTLGLHGVFVSSFEEVESSGTFGAPPMSNQNLSKLPSSGTEESCRHQIRKVVHYHIPALPAKVVGLTGAGDSVVAGFVAGLVSGRAANPVEAAAFGVAAAKRTVQSARNVPEGLSMMSIQEDASMVMKRTVRLESHLG